jgi:hypothetical protein
MAMPAFSRLRMERAMSPRRHVVPRIVVVSNYKDSRVMTIRGPDNKVVESLEVFIIPRQDGSVVTDGMGQVNLVTVSN